MKKTTAKFVQEIEVIDPDTKLVVHVAIYKEEHGGMFGVDSSYVAQEVGPVKSPFGNGTVKIVEIVEDQDREDYRLVGYPRP